MAPGGTDTRRPSAWRGRLVTAATAVAVCVAVLGAGWTLQTAVLPKPAEGKVVATKAIGWIAGTRPVASTIVTGTTPAVHASCVRGTLRFANGDVEDTARLTTHGTTTVVPAGYPYRRADGVRVGPPRPETVVRLALAGCPPVLESLIGGLLKFTSTPPTAGHGLLSGRAVRTLVVGTKSGRVTIYLDAGSKAPIAVSVSGPHITAYSRLTLGEES